MISSTPFKPLLLSVLCLTAAVFSPRSQAATATQSEAFSGMYTSTTHPQFDGVALYGSTNNGNFSSLSLPVFTTVPANTPTLLGPVTVQVPIGATNLRVSVFSVYDSATSSTVALILDPTYASSITTGNTTAFSAAFGGASESTFATNIQKAAGGDMTASAALVTFFNTYNADFPAVTGTNIATGTLVTFSNAAVGGSATLTLAPVPEPSTWAMLGVGSAGLLGLTLRRCRV